MRTQFAQHVVYHLLVAERRAAAHAIEWNRLVQHLFGLGLRPKQQPRRERDRLLRAGADAKSALHAIALDKLEQRLITAVDQGRGRTSADAGHAQRARIAVDLDLAPRWA